LKVYTIGFSGKSAEDFFKILLDNNINCLIDIRLNNKSQLSGFTNEKHLPYLLKIHGINYCYRPEYAPTKDLLDKYKGKKITWDDYEKTYIEIIERRNILKAIDWAPFDNAVLLCAEATAEKCHRRLLAEFFVKHNKAIKLRHL